MHSLLDCCHTCPFLKEEKHLVSRRKGFLNRLFPFERGFYASLGKKWIMGCYAGTFLRQLGTAGATSIIAIYMTEKNWFVRSGYSNHYFDKPLYADLFSYILRKGDI